MTKKQQFYPPRPSMIKRFVISTILALALFGILSIQEALTEVSLPESGQPAELYTNQVGNDLTLMFTTAIESAQKSITLIVYSLTDPQIISTLRNKSLQGVNIKVICDAKASPNIKPKLGKKISTLRRYGPGLMHQKILVIDEQKIWIGSANMTNDSLRLHGNLVTAIDSPLLASLITTKATTLKTEGKTDSLSQHNFMIGGQQLEMWFLPDNREAIDHLKTMIHTAEKSIRVAMFTWTRQDLAEAIIHANKRGLKTEVVIDYYAAKGSSAKIVELLKKNRIDVAVSRGGPLLHHKFMYIDDKILVNGSANWTKAAFTVNDDCFIVMHDLNEKQNHQMQSLWHKIKSESATIID